MRVAGDSGGVRPGRQAPPAGTHRWTGFGFPLVVPAQVGAQTDLETVAFYVLLVGLGLFLVYDGFTRWQRLRLMQDTPTEKVRSAAVGRTELTGAGHPIAEPLRRPFDDGQCLLAEYEIEEWDDDGDDSGSWKTVDSGTLLAPFLLDDGTGTIRVEPEADAAFRFEDDHEREIEVGSNEEEPAAVVDFLGHHTDVDVPARDGIVGLLFSERRRYTQRWIPVGADLYLLGGAEPTENDGAASSGLVLRRGSASGQFIISELSEAELLEGGKVAVPVEIVGGIGLSATGLYLLLSSLGVG